MLSNAFNYTEIARQSNVKKHKIMTFKNGLHRSLKNDEIDSIINTVEAEAAKLIKQLHKIKKQNESSK